MCIRLWFIILIILNYESESQVWFSWRFLLTWRSSTSTAVVWNEKGCILTRPPPPFWSSLTYLLTYSKEQSPYWEANLFASSQEIPRILCNPKVHYSSHSHKRRLWSWGFSACKSCSRYPFTWRRLRRMHQTLDWDICNSWLAQFVDFWGLLTNVSRTRSTVLADGPGQPLRFAAHR